MKRTYEFIKERFGRKSKIPAADREHVCNCLCYIGRGTHSPAEKEYAIICSRGVGVRPPGEVSITEALACKVGEPIEPLDPI